jgi:hypothetical protein
MVCKIIHNCGKENKSENHFEFNLWEMSLFERLFIMLNNLFHVLTKHCYFGQHPSQVYFSIRCLMLIFDTI